VGRYIDLLPIISVESTPLEAYLFGNYISFLVLLWKDWSSTSIGFTYMHFMPLFGQMEFIMHHRLYVPPSGKSRPVARASLRL